MAMLDIIPARAITEDITFMLNGESVHRMIGEYRGRFVCVIQYDASPFLCVGIDDNFQQVHIDNLNTHIESMTQE